MRILEESVGSSAWCIDRSGKVYDVYVHPYGAYDMDAIEDAAWMYLTEFDIHDSQLPERCIKYIVQQFIVDFNILTIEDYDDCEQDIRDSLQEIESIQRYSGLQSLIDEVLMRIQSFVQYANFTIEDIQYDTTRQAQILKRTLNDNIMRVRMGSEYLTHVEKSGALYFRISSDGFDWFPVIMKFCCDLSERTRISSVTIEKDKSSTGEYTVFVDHMSFNDFLQAKEFVVESLKLS